MFSTRKLLVMASAMLLLALPSCSHDSERIDTVKLRTAPHFWQRVDTTDAIYQRGPKAQQMLNRDIARCVTELRELVRLDAIRQVTPAEGNNGNIPEANKDSRLGVWDTPTREGYLRAEHLPYHDFETCMQARGWERIEHVPYNVAEEGRDAYIEAITGERHRTRVMERRPEPVRAKGDYDNLNP